MTKTILDSDNHLFCLLTGNHHPAHIDHEYAKKTKHGKPLVVGTYIFSLVVGMSVDDISREAIANLSYDSIIHHKPVFVGDTIRAESEIMSIKKQKTTFVKHVKTTAYNQHDEKVLSYERKILFDKWS